jgi:hypothetical protein
MVLSGCPRALVIIQKSRNDPRRLDCAGDKKQVTIVNRHRLRIGHEFRQDAPVGERYDRIVRPHRQVLADREFARVDLRRQVAIARQIADQSSFFRACRRWFDLSPGQYRNQLLDRYRAEA